MFKAPLLPAAAIVLALMGTQASAQGSFVHTCTHIQRHGPYLQALCANIHGGLVPSRIDVRACGGGGVGNLNGRLVCEGYGRRSRYDDDWPPRRRPRYDDDDDYGPPRRGWMQKSGGYGAPEYY